MNDAYVPLSTGQGHNPNKARHKLNASPTKTQIKKKNKSGQTLQNTSLSQRWVNQKHLEDIGEINSHVYSRRQTSVSS